MYVAMISDLLDLFNKLLNVVSIHFNICLRRKIRFALHRDHGRYCALYFVIFNVTFTFVGNNVSRNKIELNIRLVT